MMPQVVLQDDGFNQDGDDATNQTSRSRTGAFKAVSSHRSVGGVAMMPL
jgi:hypothetical protein